MFWMHLFGCRTCVAFACSLNISYRQVVFLMGVLACEHFVFVFKHPYLYLNICICIWTSVFVFEHLYLYLNVHWRAGAAYCERLWCLTLFLSEPLTFPACRWTRYTRVMNALAKVYLYLYFLFVFAIKRRLFLSEAPLYFLPMDQWFMMMCVLAKERLVLVKSDRCFNIGKYCSNDYYLDSSWNEGIPWQRWHFPPFW